MDKVNRQFDLSSFKQKILYSKEFKYACISILFFTILIFIFSPPWRVLNFDEVNYFNASRKGLWVNAFDSSSLGINNFISLVFWKLKIISIPPIFIDYSESLDTFLLRHFHPPFLQYITSYFTFIAKEDYETAEKFVFLARWGLGCIFIVSSYFISGLLFKARKKNPNYALKILFISYSALLLSLYLQYHLLIAIILLFNCYTFIRLVDNPINKNYLLFSVTLAFSIISLETTLFSIVIFSTIFLLISIKKVYSILELFRKVLIYFWSLPFIFSLILWPGALVKLSIFKSYGMYLYKIFFIKTEWVSVFDYERFTPIFALLLVYFVLLAISLFFIINSNLYKMSQIIPYKLFYIFGISYSICMLPFSLFHTYMIPGLFIASLPVLELLNYEILKKNFIIFLNFILFISISIGIFQLSNMGNYESVFGGFPGKKSLKNITEILVKKDFDLYSDGGNILKFYLPNLSTKIEDIKLIKKDNDKLDSKYKLFTREKQEYKEITFDLINKPTLFLFRDIHKDIINNLYYPCDFVEIQGLDGHACVVEKFN